jgi:hypothetical protein
MTQYLIAFEALPLIAVPFEQYGHDPRRGRIGVAQVEIYSG